MMMATDPMAGRHRLTLHRLRQRLDNGVRGIEGVELPAELESHYAKYVCVLLSGYAEQAIKELLSAYVAASANSNVAQYVAARMRSYNTINDGRLSDILAEFNEDWKERLTSEQEEGLSSLGSVVALRNSISHGQGQGVSWDTILKHRTAVYELIDGLESMLFPD